MVKKESTKGCKVVHRSIYGERDIKYSWLEKQPFKKKDYEILKPESPWYFFVTRDTNAIEHYNDWIKMNEIFPINTVGFVSGRDSLNFAFSPSEIWNRIELFAKMDTELARQTYELGKDSRDWKVKNAQEDFKNSGKMKELITSILYRPFDYRFTYYTGNSRGLYSSPQKSIMQHVQKENLGIVMSRGVEIDAGMFSLQIH